MVSDTKKSTLYRLLSKTIKGRVRLKLFDSRRDAPFDSFKTPSQFRNRQVRDLCKSINVVGRDAPMHLSFYCWDKQKNKRLWNCIYCIFLGNLHYVHNLGYIFMRNDNLHIVFKIFKGFWFWNILRSNISAWYYLSVSFATVLIIFFIPFHSWTFAICTTSKNIIKK